MDPKHRWQDPQERSNLVAEIARWLSKTGELDHYSDELAAAGEVLDQAAIIEIYSYLASERLEFEWRDEFIAAIPAAAEFLPSPEITPEDFEAAMEGGEVKLLDVESAAPQLKKQREATNRRWWQFWSQKQ